MSYTVASNSDVYKSLQRVINYMFEPERKDFIQPMNRLKNGFYNANHIFIDVWEVQRFFNIKSLDIK